MSKQLHKVITLTDNDSTITREQLATRQLLPGFVKVTGRRVE
ncbi:hypothetical protein [Paenibacillus anseongense]|nr:hypothetical protein [Paenibacillus anseongense]MEC0270175.1 hypothetical protein [Paenibacillus anseongense]